MMVRLANTDPIPDKAKWVGVLFPWGRHMPERENVLFDSRVELLNWWVRGPLCERCAGYREIVRDAR